MTIRRQTRVKAFTLTELMAVVLVIAVLAGLGLGVGMYVQRKTGATRARAQIAALELALETFRLNTGAYPTSSWVRSGCSNVGTAIMSANTVTNNWLLYTQLANAPKSYIQFRPGEIQVVWGLTNILDPFGTPYGYYCVRPSATNQINQVTFDLWSFGPDHGTGLKINSYDYNADDITNWKQ